MTDVAVQLETPRLETHYHEVVKPKLVEQFGYKNVHQIPKITKIVLNMGVGEGAQDKKVVIRAAEELGAITGQKPVITKARLSVAGFKIRDGWPIGTMVTLRRNNMFHFLDRLVSIALPRSRDFRGLNPKSFDKNGNFSMGIREQIDFPEIQFDKIDKVRGMDITIVTTAKTHEEALALLKEMKLPFRELNS